jgi:hypothetical protein
MDERKTSSQYQWQKQRLRPESERIPGASLVSGYGPDGSYSLYLPSPKAERKFVFKGGKPTLEIVGSCLDIPEIQALRNRVLRGGSASPSVSAILFVDAALIEYSAALLRLNYVLNDDDLTFIHSGRKWFEPLIQHALGGADAVKALASISRDRILAVETNAQNRLNSALRLAGGPLPEADVETVAEVAGIVAAGETVEQLPNAEDVGFDLSSD